MTSVSNTGGRGALDLQPTQRDALVNDHALCIVELLNEMDFIPKKQFVEFLQIIC